MTSRFACWWASLSHSGWNVNKTWHKLRTLNRKSERIKLRRQRSSKWTFCLVVNARTHFSAHSKRQLYYWVLWKERAARRAVLCVLCETWNDTNEPVVGHLKAYICVLPFSLSHNFSSRQFYFLVAYFKSAVSVSFLLDESGSYR